MSDLVTLAFCPSMVKEINLVDLCNKFVSATQNSRRENLFGKFVPSDLIIHQGTFDNKSNNPIVRQARHSLVVQEPPPLDEAASLNCTVVSFILCQMLILIWSLFFRFFKVNSVAFETLAFHHH